MVIEIRFPQAWPPGIVHTLTERRGDRARVLLRVDPEGCPEVAIEGAGAEQVYRFQGISPTGSGYAKIAAAWDEEGAALYINGKEVRPFEAAGGALLEFTLKEQSSTSLQIAKVAAEALGRMTREERLFIQTLQDLGGKLRSGDHYDLLKASGLVRELLIDEAPLAYQANRHHRLQLRFQILADRGALPNAGEEPETEFTALLPDGAAAAEVTVDQLWSFIVLRHRKFRYAARGIILVAAHVLGGVHYGAPRNEEERAIVALEQQFLAMRAPLPMCAVRDVACVVLDGMLPLARAIAERHKFE